MRPKLVRLTLFLLTISAIFVVPIALAAADPSQETSAQTNVESEQDSCSLTVNVQGDGAVSVVDARNRSVSLSEIENSIDVACGESVRLLARPAARSQFVSWEEDGVVLNEATQVSVEGSRQLTARFEPLIAGYQPAVEPFYDRSGQLVDAIPLLAPTWRPFVAPSEASETTAAPSIDVWYGLSQEFGTPGIGQRYANVMGTVTDADNDLASLQYTLNGGDPVEMTFGGDGSASDGRRNAEVGDFNVDLLIDDLSNGANTVVITATDSQGGQDVEEVTVNYAAGNTWPLPYSIDWGTVTNIQEALMIVDGIWTHSAAGVRTQQIAYDRLLDVGGIDFTSYEITVPVTVHSFDSAGFGGINASPALGFLLHWQGHTDVPILCSQPRCGWRPTGMASWYELDKNESGDGAFSMWVKHNQLDVDPSGLQIVEGQTYNWKVRVDMTQGNHGTYYMKVWPEGDAEPEEWLLTRAGANDSPDNGSVIILAHFADVTFGDLVIEPLGDDETPPEILSVNVYPEPNGATVQWETNETTTGLLEYGPTNAYGTQITSASQGVSHSVFIPGLQPQTTTHFRIVAEDLAENSTESDDDTFETQALVSVVSDDFNACSFAPAWTIVDPLGDATIVANGAQAQISVPGGVDHDIWPSGSPTNRAPRIMRSVTNPNNLEVKFEGGVDQAIQQQGIVLQQDANRFVRLNFQYQNGDVRFTAYGFQNGKSPTQLANEVAVGIAKQGPHYLRVDRSNGQWTFGYSDNGASFTNRASLKFPLSVNQIGVYGGNASGASSPSFESFVDYVFNRTSPISPEDETPLFLPIVISGEGTVQRSPDCGNPVSLTATPAAGWAFQQWLGSPLNGQTNPSASNVAFDNNDKLTAVFVPDGSGFVITKIVTGGGSIALSPDKAVYSDGETVTVTGIPNPGWTFDHWEEDLSGTQAQKSLVINGNKVIKAVFISDGAFAVDINVVGSGQVDVTPEQSTYAFGQQLSLQATAGSGWYFDRWSGSVSSNDNPLLMSITGDMSMTAHFLELLELDVSVDGTGTVDVRPLKEGYRQGEQVELFAQPGQDSTFLRWEGDVSSSANPLIMTMSKDTEVRAVFGTSLHQLNIEIVGPGQVDIRPEQAGYREGDQVILFAKPIGDAQFLRWGGDISGNANPYAMTMGSDMNVEARFFSGTFEVHVPIVAGNTS